MSGAPSRDQTDSPALSFRSHQDALDFADQSVQRVKDWIARQTIDLAKGYVNGKLSIVIKIRIPPGPREYDLVFNVVPNERWNIERERAVHRDVSDVEAVTNSADWNDEAMDALPANPVETPEQIATSFVRLEPAKERNDLRWEAHKFSGDHVVHFRGRVRNGKLNGIGLGDRAHSSDGTCDVIKTSAGGLHGLIGEVGENSGKVGRELYLMFLKSLRIRLDNASVGLRLEERLGGRLEILDVLACACESALGASERRRAQC
jgi:hypothetical protein